MKVLREISVPKENVNDETVIINSILFKNGDRVVNGDIIATIETSKTDFSIETDCEGYIQYYCTEGDEFHVGNHLAIIFDEYNKDEAEQFITISDESTFEHSKNDSTKIENVETEFSKPALDLISAEKIPKEAFKHKTFVSKNDVLAYIELLKKGDNKEFLTLFGRDNENIIVEKLSSSKKREIANLSNGQNNGLTCTFSININNEGILEYTRKHHSIFKLTIIPSVILEVSRLLEKFPLLNAYYDKEQIFKYKDINIGYAIDINFGLKVVSINGANHLGLADIEKELNNKLDKYSSQTLEVKDMINSTFTITDLSKSGIHYFQPLINKNQSAILGVSSVDFKSNTFNISLTFDHRITEGKTAAAFLNALKTSIEKYFKGTDLYFNRNDRIQELKEKLKGQTGELAQILNEILILID